MTWRYARVTGNRITGAAVARYLPEGYSILWEVTDEAVIIGGQDHAGWTLDDYVIPRLASGLFGAVEIPESEFTAIYLAITGKTPENSRDGSRVENSGEPSREPENSEKLSRGALALEVAERDAHVLVSTNCSALGERALEVMARYCLKETRRAAALHRPLPLPDFPPRAGASSIWLSLR